VEEPKLKTSKTNTHTNKPTTTCMMLRLIMFNDYQLTALSSSPPVHTSSPLTLTQNTEPEYISIGVTPGKPFSEDTKIYKTMYHIL